MLAGGRSRRFGEDKLTAELDGVPLLHHALLRVGAVTDGVVVVLAPGAPEPAMPAGVDGRFVRDAVPDQGPLAGALAGLGAADRPVALIVGGDMPGSVPDVLRELLARAERSPAAAALGEGDGFRPLPAAVRVEVARRVGAERFEAGERSLRGWLRALDVTVVDEATWTGLDPSRSSLRDIDEPADLDAAREATR